MTLFDPLSIRGITLRNRIVVSPMCQYSSIDGFADDWHLVHLGSRAAGGAGLVFVEASGVTAQGRITPGDMGIYDDGHIEPLARIARFVERMGAVPAIQLAHAGRKGSCVPPFHGGARLKPEDGGWTVIAPSPIPFNDTDPLPHELTEVEIQEVIAAFITATKRAIAAGFKILEIHSAHGYLSHEFLSPLSNKRTDRYGGSFENRTRLVREIATAMRIVMPDDMPLFTRISCTDWVEGGWDLPQSIELARMLKPIGVDLMDCSSGALIKSAKIPFGPGFQVPFATAIRKQAEIMTGAVGMITEAEQANEIITSGKADLAFLAREMLREPYWALKAAKTLGVQPAWPIQYGYAVKPVVLPKS
jgi:2,4-dienoyl-CoA reductase-like NADH-dependent reductase (Old Yellow Enzyme family)